ncbi:enterotoxin A family protein [Paraburkholderia phymatum]|uniref:Enterotoxin A family protein n=1 Tax=Paraburkholderia phymatum TaxID=148447 RepID=A0ACC6TWX8_9BURK
MSISNVSYGSNRLYRYDDVEEQYDTVNPDHDVKQIGQIASRPPASPVTPPRNRRQPGDGDNSKPTLTAYRRTASDMKILASWQGLGTAAGDVNSMSNQCAGLTTEALRRIGQGHASTLADVTGQIFDDLHDPRTRTRTINRVRWMQEQNEYQTTTPIKDLSKREGNYPLTSGDALVADLAEQFGVRHPSLDGRGTEQYTIAELGLTLGNGEGHAVVIQRLSPSDDYRNDQYELYDPNFGVFHYSNFANLAAALHDLYANGYIANGRIASVETTYRADSLTYRPYDPSHPGRPRLPDAPLAGIGHPEVPPLPELGPLRELDLPGPSGGLPHTEFRRGVKNPDADQQPFALYRPSTISPEELKQNDGFSADDDIPLNDANLSIHALDVKHNKDNVDGAGYLGTFRAEDTAMKKLDSGGKKDGYIYYVAPTPNMVDVNGSLGDQAPNSDDHEVAAMGHIEYTQIRGWRRVHDGKVGPYEPNPDYRWDVYDQTQTAGARPDLAGFSPENPAWGDDLHKPFASQVTRGGKTFYTPNEDPAMRVARFRQHGNALVQKLADRQSAGLDYVGPVHIKPHWGNDGGHGPVRLNFYNAGNGGYPSVDGTTGAASEDELRFGPDGRIHLARDYSKVLRIDSNGNAYIGDIPEDRNSLNGVFTYDPTTGGLLHMEDHKWLTEGASGYTPYVADAGGRGGGLMARQSWSIEDMRGNNVQPPVPEPAYNFRLKQSTAGDPVTLRNFEHDPDSVLPVQATHFVTTVPGTTSADGGNFLSYVNRIKPGEAKSVNDWLRSHNAAWIFPDGFVAVSVDSNTLEVRTIGGTPVWHVHIDPATGKELSETTQNGIASNYRIADDLWNYIKKNEDRDRELEARA